MSAPRRPTEEPQQEASQQETPETSGLLGRLGVKTLALVHIVVQFSFRISYLFLFSLIYLKEN